jgi:salicylate hydroxylase
MSIRRWDTGEIIANQRLLDMAGYIVGPARASEKISLLIPRARRRDIEATIVSISFLWYIPSKSLYHASTSADQAFFDRVIELGVPIHMGTSVVSYSEDDPSVTLATGEVVHADIVIGADGIKSTCREVVLGYEDRPLSSGCKFCLLPLFLSSWVF